VAQQPKERFKMNSTPLALAGAAVLAAAIALPSIMHHQASPSMEFQEFRVDAQAPVSEVPLLYDLIASEGLHLHRAALDNDPKAKPLKVAFDFKDTESSTAAADMSFDTLTRPGQIVPTGQADPKTGRGYQIAFAVAGEAKGNEVPVIVEYAISSGNGAGHAGAGGVVHGTVRTTVHLGSSNVIATEGNTVLTLTLS
jgi:hypothetical protein